MSPAWPKRAGESLVLEPPHFFQPDDFTCGPTCLRSVYSFWRLDLPFDQVLSETERNEDGGTLAVFLGRAALRRGFHVRLHSYNLRILDPSWAALDREAMRERIRRRAGHVRSKRLAHALEAYDSFLAEGGVIDFDDLSAGLLRTSLDRGHPLIVGLSSTYLYAEMRERPDDMKPDDIRGEPSGHFVVISGYRFGGREFRLMDPYPALPGAEHPEWVDAERLVHAILLGVLTYDGVLLEIWPRRADEAR